MDRFILKPALSKNSVGKIWKKERVLVSEDCYQKQQKVVFFAARYDSIGIQRKKLFDLKKADGWETNGK